MSSIVSEIDAVVEEIQDFSPVIAAAANFIPGASTFVTPAVAMLAALDQALKALTSAGQSPAQAVSSLVQHVTPGQPNSAVLGPGAG